MTASAKRPLSLTKACVRVVVDFSTRQPPPERPEPGGGASQPAPKRGRRNATAAAAGTETPANPASSTAAAEAAAASQASSKGRAKAHGGDAVPTQGPTQRHPREARPQSGRHGGGKAGRRTTRPCRTRHPEPPAQTACPNSLVSVTADLKTFSGDLARTGRQPSTLIWGRWSPDRLTKTVRNRNQTCS